MVRLDGVFGVSKQLDLHMLRRLLMLYQSKHLFVYDPKALQHIFVKNQQSFGQPDWFITYVSFVAC